MPVHVAARTSFGKIYQPRSYLNNLEVMSRHGNAFLPVGLTALPITLYMSWVTFVGHYGLVAVCEGLSEP